MKSDIKITAICESGQQVKGLINKTKISKSISHWIATNPSAYWECRRQNLNYSTLEELQVKKTPQQIESLQLEQITWANNVDAFLQKQIRDFELTNFYPARNYLFYLKNSWDTFIHRADLLEQIATEKIPDKIIFFKNNSPVNYVTDMTLSGSILSECIPEWAEYHGIEYTSLPPIIGDKSFFESQNHMRIGTRRKITSILPQFMRECVQSIINNPVLLHFPVDVLSSGKKTKILLKIQYDLNKTVSSGLWKNGFYSGSFDLAVAKSQTYTDKTIPVQSALTDAWQQVTDLEWFWQPNGWQKWSLSGGLTPLFKYFWFTIIPLLWKSMNGSGIFLQKKHPRAICVPSIWGPYQTGFVMAARNNDIPVIFYQHGACMGDIENTIWDLTDSYYGNYQFVYGIGAEKYIRSRCIYSGSRVVPVPVGSVRLDYIERGISEKKRSALRRSILGKNEIPLVVYVPGVFFNNFFRYDFQDLRSIRIFNVRYGLAKIFNTHPEVHFSYKAFVSEGYDPTLEMLKEICPKCSIIDNIPLTEVQWAADMIIHEIPGTGMYEGLVTNKPMIVYVDHDIYRMSDDVKEILRKRAIVSQTDIELFNDVQQFLKMGNFSPQNNPNREFVKAFCTHLDDGQSATRVVEAIATIIQKSKVRFN